MLPEKFDETKCYNWPKSLNVQTGYGQFNISQTLPSKIVSTHRYSYILFNGNLSDDELVRHKCDNRACVNPYHLEKGSQDENISDMWDRGRQQNYLNAPKKLTESQVLEIRSSNLTIKELSIKFNVSAQSISDILNKRFWKHI